MVRFLLIILILFSAVGYVIYLLKKYGLNFGVNPNLLARERISMLSLIEPLRNDLVTMESHELELISTNHKSDIKRTLFNKYVQGLYYTIYDEPVIAYAYKELSGHSSSLLVACTGEHIFTYISKNGYTKVYINETEVGTIIPEGKLISPNEKILAVMKMDNFQTSNPIFIYGKAVGEMVNTRYRGNHNPRAFVLLDRLEQDESELFLSLTLLKLVKVTLQGVNI
jgi:hypothetical protein